MTKLPELTAMDETEMRAFYESCGISKSITEAAIKARRKGPVVQNNEKPKTRQRRPLGKFIPR
jgi:hypothetical protein